ncbi:MAG: hypothetical protein PHD21_05115 [Flavobacteriales bacterium]|nr:hypothetical protein [Flavobacteriales bacterium]
MSAQLKRTRAQESSSAIEKLYVTMRHMLNRGFYKPGGVSGQALAKSLLTLSPEIYGSITDPEKVELDGLMYVLDRLPMGIEQCQYIHFTSEEGYESSFDAIIPPRRRHSCFRIDPDQMNIQITHGRSDIYDSLSHLTFLYNEASKIMHHAMPVPGVFSREWKKLEELIVSGEELTDKNRDIYITYLATLLGRSFEEVITAREKFSTDEDSDRIFKIVYYLGLLSIQEVTENKKREISFSPILRERIGHHIHGEMWASALKEAMVSIGVAFRPLHIISANMHSVMNILFAKDALEDAGKKVPEDIYTVLSKDESRSLMKIITAYAQENGMTRIKDTTGADVDVQVFDTKKMPSISKKYKDMPEEEAPVIIVIDYAFGEQAYEIMDELLRPIEQAEHEKHKLDVRSISIMGKAGILCGGKGDIMIPTAHMFEGTADNYPFDNALSEVDFEGSGLNVCTGTMISVLGTSLQNKDVLEFFLRSSWHAIGLEMEGAHYQKAIQAHSRIRNNISKDVILRYAYYASDCPLDTSLTLASGPLGETGVRPTYLITQKILEQILA